MKLTFLQTSDNKISKSQRRIRYTGAACLGLLNISEARQVCEIKNYITNQIKEELHAKTLTNLGTERIEFKCVCKNEIRLIN